MAPRAALPSHRQTRQPTEYGKAVTSTAGTNPPMQEAMTEVNASPAPASGPRVLHASTAAEPDCRCSEGRTGQARGPPIGGVTAY